VLDPKAFAPDREPIFAQPFTPQHWGVAEALLCDPDGRMVSVEAPIPAASSAADGHDGEEEIDG
jgi:hypothetical protein